MNIKLLTVEEQYTTIDQESINAIRGLIEGRVLTPEDTDYEKERQVWNAMIDRRPGMIIQCSGTADIVRAVKFAKSQNLLISIKGAGHNIAGRAIQNNVLLIDLSHLRNVKVDSEKKTATIEPGSTLGDVDEETAKHGLALPVGINSTTGISGLTLGGGFGWLSRSHGMTIDHLISAEVVTVDGEIITCDQNHHTELFWAIRGGGGNFAIISSFVFNLVPMQKEILCGPVIFDMNEGKKVLTNLRQFLTRIPENLTVWSILRFSPPFPFLDTKYHGKPIVALVDFYDGPIEEGKPYLSQLESFGNPLGSGVSPHRFTDFQKAFDPLLTPGVRNYWKTHNFKEISDALIDTLIHYGMQLPSEESEIFIAQMGGVTNQIPANATAYPHRDIEFIMNVHTRWKDSSQDDSCISWARKFFEATKPFSTGGTYSNFVSEGDDSIESAYGINAARLKQIKAEFDPLNILRTNLNISPS